MTTAKNRQYLARWMQYLQKKPGQTAHKFELMEMVEMSPRAFESFNKWFLWKMGENMKYENDIFTYRPDEEPPQKEKKKK